MTHDIDIYDLLRQHRQIAHIWSIEDVQSIRPHLTDEQSWEVLQRVDRCKDASIGISWETLEITADILYPDRPTPEELSDTSHLPDGKSEKEYLMHGDDWLCVCGNQSHTDGFFPCLRTGEFVEATASEWTDGYLYRCMRCDAIFEEDPTADVARLLARGTV